MNKVRNKTSVLHVVHGMNHGGIEAFLMSMLRSYNRDLFQMDLVYTGSQKGAHAAEVERLGSRLIKCPLRYDQIRFIYNFYKLLRSAKYDVVNTHLTDLGAGAIFAAWLAGVPIRVASYHTSLADLGFLRNLYLRVMRHIVLRFATQITTSSPMVTASHFGSYTSRQNIHAISYGVDTEYFACKPEKNLDKAKYGIGNGQLVVGHVGSYRPQKNHEALLKIVKGVVSVLPNVRFLLCGAACSSPRVTGNYKDKVDSLIKSMGLSEYIVQINGLDDMRQFYHAIDIFVLPSKQEGMPISLIEAQAAGKAIAASRINGIELATAPEMREYLFEIDDIGSFIERIIELLGNRQKRLVLGRAGQEFVRKELDIKVSAAKYLNLYTSEPSRCC